MDIGDCLFMSIFRSVYFEVIYVTPVSDRGETAKWNIRPSEMSCLVSSLHQFTFNHTEDPLDSISMEWQNWHWAANMHIVHEGTTRSQHIEGWAKRHQNWSKLHCDNGYASLFLKGPLCLWRLGAVAVLRSQYNNLRLQLLKAAIPSLLLTVPRQRYLLPDNSHARGLFSNLTIEPLQFHLSCYSDSRMLLCYLPGKHGNIVLVNQSNMKISIYFIWLIFWEEMRIGRIYA